MNASSDPTWAVGREELVELKPGKMSPSARPGSSEPSERSCSESLLSLQVHAHHVDQLVSALSPSIGVQRRISHMQSNVVSENLAHQAIHGAAHRSDELEDIRAADLSIDRAFDRIDLAADAPHAGEELRFLSSSVSHQHHRYHRTCAANMKCYNITSHATSGSIVDELACVFPAPAGILPCSEAPNSA
jgi:hypothetical protein